MNELSDKYIIGHLDFNSKMRFWLGIGLACVLFGTIGFMILAPWDPQGAISLQFVDHEIFFLVRLLGLLLVTGVFTTIIMDARLPLLGVFTTAIGVGLPIVKTAGMSYVMVRLQVGKEFEHSEALWAYMLLESLAWSFLLLILVGATVATEYWLKKGNQELTSPLPTPADAKRKKRKTACPVCWLKGLAGTAITVILTLVLISVFAAGGAKGQVTFAVITGFFLAALVAEQITENGHPVWQTIACPLVAVLAYAYTWKNPTRPPGLEALLNIAPTHLGWVLPVEYIFIGAIGAIFGTWTSERMRYNKQHG